MYWRGKSYLRMISWVQGERYSPLSLEINLKPTECVFWESWFYFYFAKARSRCSHCVVFENLSLENECFNLTFNLVEATSGGKQKFKHPSPCGMMVALNDNCLYWLLSMHASGKSHMAQTCLWQVEKKRFSAIADGVQLVFSLQGVKICAWKCRDKQNASRGKQKNQAIHSFQKKKSYGLAPGHQSSVTIAKAQRLALNKKLLWWGRFCPTNKHGSHFCPQIKSILRG